MQTIINKRADLALIGTGYWGKNIFKNLYKFGYLHTVCDVDPRVVARFKRKFPRINYTSSFDSILKSSEIKAVLIATPAATHFTIGKKALLAGKDVFIEKPLALRVSEGEELIRLAKKSDRILMVGHILQYHPAVVKLKELISKGTLGKVQYIYSNRLNLGKLRTEENILWSFAPHDISAILMLLGKEPVRISTFGGDYLNRGIYDTTLTSLEFKNGAKGHIFVSWLHPYKEQKLIVVGSKAMALFDDMTQEKLFLYRHKIEWNQGKVPVAYAADCQVIRVKKEEPLKLELEHFIQCVKKRKVPKTDGREGLKVLKVLASCEEGL